MSPEHLSCLHRWSVIVTPGGTFANRGTVNNITAVTYAGSTPVTEHPIYLRDRAFHVAANRTEVSPWLLQP